MTYDDWKTTDDTPTDEEPCPACGRACTGSTRCGCCDACIEIANYEEPMPELCTVCHTKLVDAGAGYDTCDTCGREVRG